MRRYIHNYYAQKQYFEALKDKNEIVRYEVKGYISYKAVINTTIVVFEYDKYLHLWNVFNIISYSSWKQPQTA